MLSMKSCSKTLIDPVISLRSDSIAPESKWDDMKSTLTFEALVQQGAPGESVLLLQAGSGFLSAPSPQEYYQRLECQYFSYKAGF